MSAFLGNELARTMPDVVSPKRPARPGPFAACGGDPPSRAVVPVPASYPFATMEQSYYAAATNRPTCRARFDRQDQVPERVSNESRPNR
jgi:hypothetical protein